MPQYNANFVFVQGERTSTAAGSRIIAKVVLCASTDCACARPATTSHPGTASAFVKKVPSLIVNLLLAQLNQYAVIS